MTSVHIELQRVQTWLFAVPRLRAMVGANTLLGEVLRDQLPDLARKPSAAWRLAAQNADGYPSALDEDPLKAHDDPAVDAREGILSRDGGHFEVVLESGEGEFIAEATALLQRDLPGVRYRISVDGARLDAASVDLSTELPVLAPCAWTGRGLGSCTRRQGNDLAWVSRDASQRHDAAIRAEDGQAHDLVNLLAATTCLTKKRRPQTFEELAAKGYLSIIHADGNGVGMAAPSDKVERATFYHRNRVLLRRAVGEAIESTCADAASAPLIPLMLGGDDLLVVCRADIALPFVVRLCDALAEFQRHKQSAFALTLGVGVVFARPTIPIHRLHEVAERLAGSAKRRFRGFSETEPRTEPRSVVDWAVYTTSWLDDPEAIRRRDWVRGAGKDRRVLSRRPVDVLGEGLDSLQGLVSAAEKIKKAPRSQLRTLVEHLPRGRALSELAFAELSQDARDALKAAGITEVWEKSGDGPLLTSVGDLVDVCEIGRLGQAGTSDNQCPPKTDSEGAADVKA